ncbi:MAG: hypothetical protein KJ626_12315 [Verrucomicrobia bacterium]|nr:hypothetical protein [Verrucomicrobiota bacterium]
MKTLTFSFLRISGTDDALTIPVMDQHREMQIGGKKSGLPGNTLLCVCSLLLFCAAMQVEAASPPDSKMFDVKVFAENLSSPDGLAIHPVSGDIYVAEEKANRVSVIKNGKAKAVITENWEFIDELPAWAVTTKRPLSYWHYPRLRFPEGIAFSPEGHLFVTEDVADGRLLEFIPDEKGNFTQARAIPIPYLDMGFSWESVAVAKDGRLFLAGSTLEAGSGIFFGSVLMRDAKEEWWLVDYGPFVSFSSVSLSRDEDVVVIGDEVGGSVVWWDAVRHYDVGVSTGYTRSVEGTCVLPDGSILAAEECIGEEGKSPEYGGRLVRIEPHTGRATVVADDFECIESVVMNDHNGRLYVTDDRKGVVLELTPRNPFDESVYLLERSLFQREVAQSMAPKKWPEFLGGFVSRLGVGIADEDAANTQKPKEVEEKTTFTLKEFAERIPLIAGKIKTSDLNNLAQGEEKDPLEEIQFISFFPNRALAGGENPTPSLSLFAARRKSGAVEVTRTTGGLKASRYTADGRWVQASDNAFLCIPITSCAAVQRDTHLDLSVSFLGLGFTPDYHLTMRCGERNEATLMVDGGGETMSSYGASFIEKLADGRTVENLVVAGFEARKDHDQGWLRLGRHPVSSSIIIDDNSAWIPRSMKMNNSEVLSQLKQKDQDWVLAMENRVSPENGDDIDQFAGSRWNERDGEMNLWNPAVDTADIQIRKKFKDEDAVTAEEKETDGDDGNTAYHQEDTFWTNYLFSRAAEVWTLAQF